MNIFTRSLLLLTLLLLGNLSFAQTSFYWKSISAAEDYTIAVKYDGTLWAWGRNQHGQLGDGTKIDKNQPVQIGSNTDWKQASAYAAHSVAVKNNGELYTWGKNENGELGNTTTGGDVLSPTKIVHQISVNNTPIEHKWQAAYAGDGFTIAVSLTSNNSIWGWGKNDKAQLGQAPSALSESATPVQIMVPRRQITTTIFAYATVYSIDVAKDHVVALLYDFGQTSPALPTDPVEKNIVVWGDNSSGQLGTGHSNLVTSPTVITELDLANDPNRAIKKFEKVATGAQHSFAIRRDGSLWVWGSNADGKLGVDMASVNSYTKPTQILATQQWKDVVAGNNFSTAITTGGTLWTWGANDKGQLANGTSSGSTWQAAQEASLANTWEMASSGDKFAFAVKKDGSIWAWGDNEYGQLGIGNVNLKNQPTLLNFSQFPSTFERVENTGFPNLVKGAMVWGDYNNDGFPDVFISGSAKTTSTANRAELWKNNGDQTFTKVETAVFVPMSNTSASWIDFNNDGLLDIFVSGSTSSARGGAASKLYKNNGNGTFTEILSPVANPTTAELNSYGNKFPGIFNNATKAGAEWADIDNDGFIDLIISGLTQTAANVTRIYKNNGNETFTLAFENTFASSSNSALSWIDYNNDGYKDLVIQTKVTSNVVTRLYKNNAGLGFTEVAKQDAPFRDVDAAGITWGDYNNDGYLDVLVCGGISGAEYTELYQNNGDGKFLKLANTGLTGVDKASAVMIDLDNDGLQDIVVGGNIGNNSGLMAVKYFKNNGDDTFTELATPFYHVKNTDLSYADINNDGKPDLLIGGHNNTEGTTNLYLNVASGTPLMPTPPQQLTASRSGNTLQLSWAGPTVLSGTGKYNIRLGSSSGKNDLISGLNNQQLVFAEGQQESFTPKIVTDPSKAYYFSVQVTDAAGNKSPWSTELVIPAEVLPVTLVDFEVKKEVNAVKISWATLSETNHNRFEIERAGDDGEFISIATIKPSATSGRISYNTYDHKPLNGNNYYRLRQYDNNGDNVVYQTKVVNFSLVAKASANVYPVPSNGSYINISLSHVEAKVFALRVIDINGRVVHQQQLANGDSAQRIDFANKLNNGIYFVQLTGNQLKETLKLIVQ